MGNERGLALMSTEERIKLYDEKARKRFTFLRGVCTDGHHPNLTRALGFARERHRRQTRKSGEPYIIHPLSLACDAVGMEINDDVLLAALVLHDLLEDTPTLVTELPVDDETKKVVECMTLRTLPGESKFDSKKRYFETLFRDRYATIGKGLDRRDNLGAMAKTMPKTSIIKNCFESKFMLLPMLKDAKEKWPEYSNPLHTIRTSIDALVGALSAMVGMDLEYEEPPSDELMARILEVKTDDDLDRIPEIFNMARRF